MTEINLIETSLEENETLNLFNKILLEDKESKFIWNVSNNSLIWENMEVLRKFLSKDFDKSHIYIAYLNHRMLGVFGTTNISDISGSANLLVWIDEAIRSSIFLIKWWTIFLRFTRDNGIKYLYAKIQKSNIKSLNAAKRYGFASCKSELYTGINNKERYVLKRATFFNEFEQRYINKFHVFK